MTVNVAMLLQGETVSDQIGYYTAFEKAYASGRLSGYRAFCYRTARSTQDWNTLWDEVHRHCRDTGADVVFLQYFHGLDIPDPRPYLDQILALPQHPIIVTSCGDPFGPILEPPPRSLMQAASRSDVFLTTSMGRLAALARRSGAKAVSLMAHSACDVRFGGDHMESNHSDPSFDVVFIGSKHGGRNCLRGLYWSGRHRADYVDVLTKRYGRAFALYGHRWEGNPSWQGSTAFEDQVSVCHAGRVVFGGFPGSRLPYYTSNRPFIQALSSRPMVDYRVAGVELFLADETEWFLFSDIDAAVKKIDLLLDHPDLAQHMGSAAARAVRERHMNSHRVALMIDMFEELVTSRRTGRNPSCPPLPFLNQASSRVGLPTSIGW